MDNIDLSQFNSEDDDIQKIKNGHWVPCRICQNAFSRIRLTKSYCARCHAAFCEGEHGNFAQNRGVCVQCGSRVSDKRD